MKNPNSPSDRVLVTGGAGYIGSHTVQKLLDAGFSPVVFDNLSTGFREAVPAGVPFVQGDILDFQKLETTLREFKVDLVIHFAAKLVVPESVENPLLYYENNTQGVVSMLKAMRAAQVNKIVFSSTAAVYGNHPVGLETSVSDAPGLNRVKLSEVLIPQPESPYGWSKFMSERIILDAEPAYRTKAVILRYFNVAGASLSGINGQRTRNATHLIKVAAEVACGKRPLIKVFGTDYPTPDGTGVRDYIHVEDLADAHVLAAQKLLAHPQMPSEVLNCGYGQGYSVLEVLTAMEKVSGKPITRELSARRAGDPALVVAESQKIKQSLGWVPQHDDLELICKTALDWEKTLS
jgi:UDP-glucose 4-epimerase